MGEQAGAWIGKADNTPLGAIWIGLSAIGLVAISLWDDQKRFETEVYRLTQCRPVLDSDRIAPVSRQLGDYLNKERQSFDLTIDWSVLSPFQKLVLHEVLAIPFGRLSTYGDIARRIGKPESGRAVGRANATNPMPIVIPCHRVIGSDGKLHGYGAPGGLETKAWLLRLEGSWLL